jgi:hypothetical protein
MQVRKEKPGIHSGSFLLLPFGWMREKTLPEVRVMLDMFVSLKVELERGESEKRLVSDVMLERVECSKRQMD